MTRLTDLQYLKLSWIEKFGYKLKIFFLSIPAWFARLGKKIGLFFKKLGLGFWNMLVDIGRTFKLGNWATKLSFLIMGFGNFYFGQIGRGILFLLFEAVFIAYMCVPNGGAYWLSKMDNLGDECGYQENSVWITGDDSFRILLYGLLTVVFIMAFVYTWRLQVKQCRINREIKEMSKNVPSAKDDLKSLVDDNFHKTLLALPMIGIALFTVLPIIFMVLIAFTSYDGHHDGHSNLFTWTGFANFEEIFTFGSTISTTFGELLTWTLLWAFFATFTTYFLGIFVAMMINKKGIKFKKFWRTILVMTIAIPQFVSLVYISKSFMKTGWFSTLLWKWGLLENRINFWEDQTWSRVLLIVINIWIGIPYVMLQATGILMNIPADLYESAKIDGASGWKQFTKITMPYLFFVTGPYLLTSFIGNLNNFNVIYLLSGGGPTNPDLAGGGASVGYTDLLVTWLFKLTIGGTDANYKMASVIGIMIFAVVSILSLIVYNVMPSTRNEEDYR